MVPFRSYILPGPQLIINQIDILAEMLASGSVQRATTNKAALLFKLIKICKQLFYNNCTLMCKSVWQTCTTIHGHIIIINGLHHEYERRMFPQFPSPVWLSLWPTLLESMQYLQVTILCSSASVHNQKGRRKQICFPSEGDLLKSSHLYTSIFNFLFVYLWFYVFMYLFVYVYMLLGICKYMLSEWQICKHNAFPARGIACPNVSQFSAPLLASLVAWN